MPAASCRIRIKLSDCSADSLPELFIYQSTVSASALQFFNQIEQGTGIDWLCHVSVESGILGLLLIIEHGVARNSDQRHSLILRQVAQPLSQLITVHLRHANVGDYYIKMFFTCRRKRCLRGSCSDHVVAGVR